MAFLWRSTNRKVNPSDGGVPLGRSPQNFSWMSTDGQGTKWRRNIVENFNRLSMVHERYRLQTDGRQHIAYVNVSSCSLKTITAWEPVLPYGRGCIIGSTLLHKFYTKVFTPWLFFVLMMGILVSLFVRGSQFFVLGWIGLKKCRPTPTPDDFFLEQLLTKFCLCYFWQAKLWQYRWCKTFYAQGEVWRQISKEALTKQMLTLAKCHQTVHA